MCEPWHPCVLLGEGVVRLWSSLIIFGMCKTTGTTGKDNMSGCWVIWSREDLLSRLKDRKLRVN